MQILWQLIDCSSKFWYIITNIMLESCKDERSVLSETELYDLLTEFMRIFRAFLRNCESIIAYLSKSLCLGSMLDALKDMLAQLKKFQSIQDYQIDTLSPHSNIYLRFASRLFEMVSACRNRKQHTETIYTFYASFINRIEKFINAFKIQKKLGKFFRNFFHLSTKFCNGCEIMMTSGTVQEALQALMKIMDDHKSIEAGIKVQQNEDRDFKKSPSFFKRQLNEQQLKFFHMNCLDLDYNHLNTTITTAQNQKQELVKSMADRNRIINKLMMNYSRQYEVSFKRKAKLQMKGIRNKEVKSLSNSTFTTNFKIKNKIYRTVDASLIINTDQSSYSRFQESRVEPQQFSESKQQKSISKYQEETRRSKQSPSVIFHPVKNLYLTLEHPQLSGSRTYKSNPKNTNRTLDDASRIYSILKSSKCGFKPNKIRQNSIEKGRPIMQVKKMNIKGLNCQYDHEKLIQLLSIGSQTLKEKDQSMQKLNIINKSRTIRNQRNVEIAQAIKNCNASPSNQSKMSRNHLNRRQAWIKQLTIK